MKFLSGLAALVLPLTLSAVSAQSLHGPHEHGTMAVAVTKQDSMITFTMAVPSIDLLGFEDSPEGVERQQWLNMQYEKLYQESALPALFKITPAGACAPHSSHMESDMLTYHTHDEDGHQHADEDDGAHKVGDADGHSDFELTYVYDCLDTLESIQITFADVFPTIKTVDFYGGGDFSGKVVRSSAADDAILTSDDL